MTRRYEPIMVRRATTEDDEYGDPQPDDWADLQEYTAKFAPSNPSEDLAVGRNTVITGGAVYIRDLPSRPDIRSSDRVIVRGVELDVDGEIGAWLRADTWAVQFAVKGVGS